MKRRRVYRKRNISLLCRTRVNTFLRARFPLKNNKCVQIRTQIDVCAIWVEFGSIGACNSSNCLSLSSSPRENAVCKFAASLILSAIQNTTSSSWRDTDGYRIEYSDGRSHAPARKSFDYAPVTDFVPFSLSLSLSSRVSFFHESAFYRGRWSFIFPGSRGRLSKSPWSFIIT